MLKPNCKICTKCSYSKPIEEFYTEQRQKSKFIRADCKQCCNKRVVGYRKKNEGYENYRGMRERCNNPNHSSYGYYGGKGIQFKFKSFKEFQNSIGEKPSSKHEVGRIDNSGHYEPGNVRWVTHTENIRNSTCVILCKDDITEIKKMMNHGLSNTEISLLFNISRNSVSDIRLNKSWKDV